VPPDWIPVIRETMPAYDATLTPTRGMGIIAETFRKWPGTIRSCHPNLSLVAWGVGDKLCITELHDHRLLLRIIQLLSRCRCRAWLLGWLRGDCFRSDCRSRSELYPLKCGHR
jgi:hypothetical protein